MRDAEYIYYSDIQEKKRNARGTYNKKRQGGKTVRLQNDHLKRKDWEKMNGKVQSYDLGKPMTWAEFKKLPTDLASRYMVALRDTFHMPLKEVAKIFGVENHTVYVHTKKNGITPCWQVGGTPKTRNRFYEPDIQEKYERWMCGDLTLNAVASVVPEKTEPVTEPEAVPEDIPEVVNVAVTPENVAPAIGGLTLDALVNMLRQMGCTAEISISIKV